MSNKVVATSSSEVFSSNWVEHLCTRETLLQSLLCFVTYIHSLMLNIH